MAENLTQEGIAALKSGDRVKARYLLRAATNQNADDILAWLWLAGAVDSDQERLNCLARVLELDPGNTSAAKGLAQMVAQGRARLQATDEVYSALPVSTEHSVGVESSPQLQETPSDEAVERQVFFVTPSLIPVLLSGATVFLVIVFSSLFLISVASGTMMESLANCLVGPLILVTLFAAGYGLLVRYFTRYTLTTRRLIVEAGILGRSKQTIPLQRIQDVSYRQSPIERLFGIGDVLVESAGERGEIRLQDLAECKHRTEQILGQVEHDI